VNRKKDIPEIVVERLPKYYRYFKSLIDKKEKVSSREVAEAMATSASQIRLDLSHFGGFGLQGYGYNVKELYEKIGSILSADRQQSYIIVGVGNLGVALARYPMFDEAGFVLDAAFDVNPKVIGTEIGGVKVLDVSELSGYVKSGKSCVAVIATPAEAVPEISTILQDGGICGIINFAPVDIYAKSDDLPVQNIHLADKFLTLSYWINTCKSC